MISPKYIRLLELAAPEAIIVVGAFAALFVDLGPNRTGPHRKRSLAGSSITVAGCLAASLWMVFRPACENVFNGLFVVEPTGQLVKHVLLALTAFTAVISLESKFTEHVGEYFALLLLATTGMMFLVSSEELLMIFVSLELTSLSLYVLTAFNKRSIESAEAALKYFLFGGVAAAFMLFGLSLLYGLTGVTRLREIPAHLQGQAFDPLLALAIVMVVVGLGFKIAAVPFHLWAPDAYQGAPTPCAALIASGSKVASFFVFAKVMTLGFAGVEGSGSWRHLVPGWMPVLSVLALLSIVLGNLAAIAQASLKRLLAYSAIAHAGYMLLGLLAMANPGSSGVGMASLLYYVTTYALTAVGGFGVVAVIESRAGTDRIDSLAGLSKRSPALALCLLVFMLSLAGIPPAAGFLAKFYVFTCAVGSESRSLGLLWLVIVAILFGAVSLYYYLQVLKRVYVSPPAQADAPLPVGFQTKVTLGLLAGVVLLFGIVPTLLLDPLQFAIGFIGGPVR